MCKLQTQDVNFLLIHSCTQGSGTTVHLNLFFLLVFVIFLRMFSLRFLLAVCYPNPYGFTVRAKNIHSSFQQHPPVRPKPWKDGRTNSSVYLLQATWSSKTNLGSHTLPNNQFGRTFGSDAFQFEWSLTGRSGVTEGIPGFTYPGCQRLFMRGFRFRSSLKKWPARKASGPERHPFDSAEPITTLPIPKHPEAG